MIGDLLTSKSFCEVCGKSYVHRKDLTRHKRYECGVLPQFPCDICSKRFRYSSVKLEHETTHEFACQTPEGPFICDFCQKKYKHKRTLMTHKKYECENSLTISGPHICDICGKVYKHRRNLCAHKKYDCGMEPQFACIICSRKFKFKSNLKAHLNACHKKHIALTFPMNTFLPSGLDSTISSIGTFSHSGMSQEVIPPSGRPPNPL